MGIRQATDVLSFPAGEPFWSQGFLGSLAICLPVAERQAKQYSHSLRTELKVLLIHGFLHLLGFDHEKGPAHAREMKRWESKLLVELGASAGAGLLLRSRT